MVDRRSTPKWDLALAGLSHDQAEDVHRRMRAQSYPPRTALFREGEPSDTLVIVRNGRVRLYLVSEDGDEFTLSLLTGGSILGLAAAVLRRPRALSVESVDSVDVSILPVEEMAHCMRTIPQFAINLTQLLATLAIESIARSGPLALDSAALRLGRILVAVATPRAQASGPLVVEGLTHEDLAKMIGATRTWVSLTLSDFERKRLISKQPGRIVILDAARLQAGH